MTNLNINTLNNASQSEFTDVLAEIYEHSSWIPNKAWHARPFSNVNHLHRTMLSIVEEATREQKMQLLCAHPQLAGKEAKTGTLTDASTAEQSSANLNSLSKEEINEINHLNDMYVNKHGFPFIIAVKNHDKAGIFSEFRNRANNLPEIEFDQAIDQVGQIARFRLSAIFESNNG